MEYKVWWPLHVRAAKGEILTPEESEILKDAYAEQDRDERDQLEPGYVRDGEALQKLTEEVNSLQLRIALSQKERRRVQSQIRRLSKAPDPATKDTVRRSSVS